MSAKINDEKRVILSELISVTREIVSKYSQQLVTEKQSEVEKLLSLLDRSLCFGLKNNSLLGNVQELFAPSSCNGNLFWTFAFPHLAKHDQERFTSGYKNVSGAFSIDDFLSYLIPRLHRQLWTDRGKTKALIRNALNERCLERYLLTWLSAENLNEFYEPFSMLRDEKSATILPKLASDLSSILFAISIDVPELNVTGSKAVLSKPEPIIAVPNSSKVIKSSTAKHHRSIEEFEETVKESAAQPEVVPPAHTSYQYQEAYQQPYEIDQLPHFSDKISICTESSYGSASNDMTKDDDSISQSSTSSGEDQPEPQAISKLPINPEPPANASNQIDNEALIQKQRARIMELEGQIMDLTQENSRLKNLLSSNKVNTLANLHISIPRAVLQKTKTKNFYVYEINLRSKNGEETWTLFKRYRDFHSLHKQLKKQHIQIKALDFPPKKKLGNLDFDFVEERRQRLQVYLRHVVQNLPELASCENRKFLEAKCSFFKT